MKKQVESRLSDLENKSKPDRPMIAVFQDFDDPEVYHVGSRENDQLMAWPEIETKYKDWLVIRVVYREVINEKTS